jgi:RNA exonuclease 4
VAINPLLPRALFGTREMRPDAGPEASVVALAANGEVKKKKKKKKVKDKAAVASEGKAGGSNWAALSTVSTLGIMMETFPHPPSRPPSPGATGPRVTLTTFTRHRADLDTLSPLNSQKIGAGKNPKAKRKREEREAAAAAGERSGLPRGGIPHAVDPTKPKKPMPTGRNTALTDTIAMDCEMVGVGDDGKRSILARVSVVNEDGNVVLDTFVAPTEPVADYRTRVSGVRPQDLRGAPPFKEIQRKMADILRGRVLVGHALKNDLRVLLLDHPRRQTRDTALYRPLTRPLRANERAQDTGIARGRGSRSLKELCAQHLGLEIQGGEHSSVDDARAALLLYQANRRNWERDFAAQSGGKGKGTSGGGSNTKARDDDDEPPRPTKRGKKAGKKGGDDVGVGGGLRLGKAVNLFSR